MPLVRPILGLLRESFDLSSEPEYFECYLSVVTAPASSLDPIQRFPHFDGVEPDRIAVLLYLDRAEQGGTAFYRQRETGFESVNRDRFEAYRTALDAGVAEHGMPPAGYIVGDTSLFERTHHVAGRYNRMIAYRGNSLHCAALGAGFTPRADPAHGRLTLNLFLRGGR